MSHNPSFSSTPKQLAVTCLEVVVIDWGDGCHVALGIKNTHMGQVYCLKRNLHQGRHDNVKAPSAVHWLSWCSLCAKKQVLLSTALCSALMQEGSRHTPDL